MEPLQKSISGFSKKTQYIFAIIVFITLGLLLYSRITSTNDLIAPDGTNIPPVTSWKHQSVPAEQSKSPANDSKPVVDVQSDPPNRSYTPAQMAIEMEQMFAKNGLSANIDAQRRSSGAITLTITSNDFAGLPASSQKDMMSVCMNGLLNQFGRAAHSVILRNNYRDICKATWSSWSGLEYEFY